MSNVEFVSEEEWQELQNGIELDIKNVGIYVPNNVDGNMPKNSYILRGAAIDEIYHHFPSLSHTEAAMVLHTVPSADVVEVVRCKDCKHFELNKPYVIQGVPVLGHEVCNVWGDGCKTDENGWCFLAERRTDE